MQFQICFQNTCTLELWIEILSKKKKKKLIKTWKYIIYIWHPHNVYKLGYGLPTTNNPILLQNSTNVKLDLLEHLQELFKF
jgi:hypothetical protein